MISSSKLVRCECLKLLCKRVPMDNGEFIIHIKHRGFEIYSYHITAICPSCGRSYEITASDGKSAELSQAKQE